MNCSTSSWAFFKFVEAHTNHTNGQLFLVLQDVVSIRCKCKFMYFNPDGKKKKMRASLSYMSSV